MRTFFGLVIAVVLAATIWWTFPIQAKQQFDHDSIDPLAMMVNTGGLPQAHYTDYSTIY